MTPYKFKKQIVFNIRKEELKSYLTKGALLTCKAWLGRVGDNEWPLILSMEKVIKPEVELSKEIIENERISDNLKYLIRTIEEKNVSDNIGTKLILYNPNNREIEYNAQIGSSHADTGWGIIDINLINK